MAPVDPRFKIDESRAIQQDVAGSAQTNALIAQRFAAFRDAGILAKN
jgi:hypothetical protein